MRPRDRSTIRLPKLPDRIVDQLKHPAVATVALTWAKRLGEETNRWRSGQIDRDEFTKRAQKHLAEISGTTVGATVGSVVGGMVPGVGKLVGAFAGGMLGQYVGQHFGDLALDRHERKTGAPEEKNPPDTGSAPKRSM